MQSAGPVAASTQPQTVHLAAQLVVGEAMLTKPLQDAGRGGPDLVRSRLVPHPGIEDLVELLHSLLDRTRQYMVLILREFKGEGAQSQRALLINVANSLYPVILNQVSRRQQGTCHQPNQPPELVP